MGSYIEDANTMRELYGKDFKGFPALSDNDQDRNAPEAEDEKGISVFLWLIIIPLLAIELIWRIFVTEPRYYWRPKTHLMIGLIKFFTYWYVLYSITDISEWVEIIGIEENVKVFVMAFICIFSMIQIFHGIGVAGGWYSEAPSLGSSLPPHLRKPLSKEDLLMLKNAPKPKSYFDTNHEIEETYRYMNAKMGGMSNRKKEQYLRDFHGGNR